MRFELLNRPKKIVTSRQTWLECLLSIWKMRFFIDRLKLPETKLCNNSSVSKFSTTKFRVFHVFTLLIIFRSPSNIFTARKSRDTLAKAIYSHLFKIVVVFINRSFASGYNQTDQSITILDIAGFGRLFTVISAVKRLLFLAFSTVWISNAYFFYTECFNTVSNRFEQFCFNFSNEKIQSFCTQRLIFDEQNHYKNQGIEIPTIPFPGNEIIIGYKSIPFQ